MSCVQENMTHHQEKRGVRRAIMSQDKVNQYKESKKNRKEAVKKEKQKALLTKICAAVVGLAIVVWIGYSAVVSIQNAQGPAVTVDTSAVTEYLDTVE